MKNYQLILYLLCLGVWSCKESDPEISTGTRMAASSSDSASVWSYIGDFPPISGLPASFRNVTTFVIDKNGYLVTSGEFGDNSFVLEYNTVAKTFATKSRPNSNIDQANSTVSFALGEFGYMGGGLIQRAGAGGAFLADFEQYDPKTNNWVRKQLLPIPFFEAVGFSIGSKGYIGTGFTGTDGTEEDNYQGTSELTNDFYEYDPQADTWTKRASFPGKLRQDAVGFSIGNKGYVGTGRNRDCYFQDFWEYDPQTNKWRKMADFPGVFPIDLVGFSIGDKGYVGSGFRTGTIGTGEGEVKSNFWEFDPQSNTWKLMPPFPSGYRENMLSFVVDGKGYVGGGSGDGNTQELWMFDPSKY
ncbi:MAG: type sorting protein [Daejeonella sp.]|nr:type sorting protein [Daejeonella sp.]